ncbi:MAG: phosphoribosylamine--glycine ligase [Candidatus Bathyarchaeota archaeon]|nr:phosphoribosylamine--glycine ligase [Candidatus Bathyarchaeota archaeon]
MKVLVVGNGAREHAITRKLAEEDIELTAAMSRLNPGIAALCKTVEIIDINNTENYDRFKGHDMAFIGPEAPLAEGVADKLWSLGVPVVGPTKPLAKLEWSKSYTREVLDEHEIEGNPGFKICRNIADVNKFLEKYPEVAVKPDVLTGGKGVKVSGDHLHSQHEVKDYAAERINADGLVVLEEKLIGEEFTLQAFTDGHRVEVMPLVRDFKRAYDDDKGPNTGSMGSYSCEDHGMSDLSKEVIAKGTKIMEETIKAMTETVGKFKGPIYGGFMNTPNDVYLIEYNCRMGDPEAINVLSLLETPLTEMGYGMTEGNLPKPAFMKKATVCVYLVPEGYPTNPVRDQPIEIGEPASEVYYASVYDDNGVIRTTSSRAVALLAKGDNVQKARKAVYKDVNKVKGRLHYRTDIAKHA